MKPKKDKFRLNIVNWITVIIMSASGAVATHLYLKSNKSEPRAIEENQEEQVSAVLYTADIKRITEQCTKMVSSQNSFALFEHGTCVRLLEPIVDPSESALSTLEILASPSVPFVVKPLNNNDYLVVFNEYLFCWIFAKDIADIKQALTLDKRLEPSKNDESEIQNLPDFQRRVGKLARLLLLQDANSKKIVQILRAKPVSPAHNPTK